MELNSRRPFQPGSAQPLGGRYQIVQQLGAGGFGQTFLANDLHLPGRPICVVKQLNPQVKTPEELQMARRLFDTEAQVLYQLGSHPQIPRLLAHFEENNEFYLAQELVEGHPLTEELASGTPWADAAVVALLEDILSTLAFVHSNQVIHRDLNPSNLIRRQSDQRIVLIDFGAVKQVSTQVTATRSGISHTISIGTQGYMPNEQIAGRPQFSSDVYAVGMIAIQALTGHHPSQINPDPRTAELDWHGFAPHSHPALVALLDYMVRYDFRTRYATAAETLSALQAVSQELQQGGSPATGAYASPSQPKTIPVAMPQQRAAAPYPPSPSMAVKTVAVGRQPQPTNFTQPSAPVDRDQRTEVAPRRRARPPRKQPFLPLGIGLGLLLVVGLLTWRACTPATPVDTVTTVPNDADPANPTPETADPTQNPTPDPEPSPEAVQPPAAEAPAPEAATPEEIPAETPEEAPEPSQPEPPAAPPPPAAEAPPAAALNPGDAQATVATFYGHVSSQSWDAARSLSAGALAQQFDPGFFQQFQQVTVENLQVTNQSADSVELVGQNTYVYPDGSTQREERAFTVQMVNGQPRIVGSSFLRVTKGRNE